MLNPSYFTLLRPRHSLNERGSRIIGYACDGFALWTLIVCVQIGCMCVRKQDSSITISTLRAMRSNRKTYGIVVKDESVLEVFGQAAPVERTFGNTIIGFITRQRVVDECY